MSRVVTATHDSVLLNRERINERFRRTKLGVEVSIPHRGQSPFADSAFSKVVTVSNFGHVPFQQ